MNPNIKLRLDLTDDEHELLLKMVDALNAEDKDFLEDGRFEGYGFVKDSLLNKVQNVKQIELSKKIGATRKANEAKRERTRQRVEEAIISLSDKGDKVTAYSVAKVSGVSFNTAKRFLDSQRPPEPLSESKAEPIKKKGKAGITNQEALSLIGLSTKHSDGDIKLLQEVFTLSGVTVTDTGRLVGFSHASVLTNIITGHKGIGNKSRELLKAYVSVNSL